MDAYVYPAVFKKCDDQTYFVRFPDIPNAMTQGRSLDEALYMASDVLRICIAELLDRQEPLPVPSEAKTIPIESDEFCNFIRAEMRNTTAVRRTVSLPKWMDERATREGISLSKTLQASLENRFHT